MQTALVEYWSEIARQVLPNLQIGAEVFHQTAEIQGGRASTTLGGGVKYDLNETYHLLGYVGPTIQNASAGSPSRHRVSPNPSSAARLCVASHWKQPPTGPGGTIGASAPSTA